MTSKHKHRKRRSRQPDNPMKLLNQGMKATVGLGVFAVTANTVKEIAKK